MSSGRVHDALTLDLQIPVSIITGSIVFIYTHDIIYTGITIIMIILGMELQRFTTPDLDIISNREYKYGFYPLFLIYNVFGYIPYLVWRAFWWPYSYFLPHRSILSHGFIIGTIIRLSYLFTPVFILTWILKINPIIVLNYWDLISFFIIGFFLSDVGHLALDYIPWFRYLYEGWNDSR